MPPGVLSHLQSTLNLGGNKVFFALMGCHPGSAEDIVLQRDPVGIAYSVSPPFQSY